MPEKKHSKKQKSKGDIIVKDEDPLKGRNSKASMNSIESKQKKSLEETKVTSSRGGGITPPSDATNAQFQEYLVCTRGLKNLGNTCFFNSTMQCLNASKDLVFKYVMPKSLPYSDGGINLLLRNFFMDVRRVSNTYNPGQLFSGICSRNSRFKGFQ